MATKNKKDVKGPWWTNFKMVTVLITVLSSSIPLATYVSEQIQLKTQNEIQKTQLKHDMVVDFLDKALDPNISTNEKLMVYSLMKTIEDEKVNNWADSMLTLAQVEQQKNPRKKSLMDFIREKEKTDHPSLRPAMAKASLDDILSQLDELNENSDDTPDDSNNNVGEDVNAPGNSGDNTNDHQAINDRNESIEKASDLQVLFNYDQISDGQIIQLLPRQSGLNITFDLYDKKPNLIGKFGNKKGFINMNERLLVLDSHTTFSGYKWLKVEKKDSTNLIGWYSWENIKTITILSQE